MAPPSRVEGQHSDRRRPRGDGRWPSVDEGRRPIDRYRERVRRSRGAGRPRKSDDRPIFPDRHRSDRRTRNYTPGMEIHHREGPLMTRLRALVLEDEWTARNYL